MPENEKKNGLLSLFRGVFKTKKEECPDIVTQAENVISDYICKRRNEIINKYCAKNSFFPAICIIASAISLLYIMYLLLI